jgi:hypothetical protein
MRTLIRAVLISMAVCSATCAVACPIDLAPCEEVTSPSRTIDTRGDRLISAFWHADDNVASTTTELEFASAPREGALLNHEDDIASDDHQRSTAIWQDEPDGLSDSIEALLILASTELPAVPTRKFLVGDEDLIDIDHTGSPDGQSSSSFTAQPERAMEGYEDR